MFDFFEKVFESLTGTRGSKGLIVAILFLVLFPFGLWVFESYTKSFQLQRLSKEAEILDTTSKIFTSAPFSDAEISNIRDERERLINDLSHLHAKATFAYQIKIPMVVQNFGIGMIFWILVAIAAAKGEKDANKRIHGVLALIFIGTLISIGAAFLPRVYFFLGHVLFYPIGLLVLFFLFVLLVIFPLVRGPKS